MGRHHRGGCVKQTRFTVAGEKKTLEQLGKESQQQKHIQEHVLRGQSQRVNIRP